MVKDIVIGARDLGSIPWPIKSNTVSPMARHLSDVPSQPCWPNAKLRRWPPLRVTRLGVVPRV